MLLLFTVLFAKFYYLYIFLPKIVLFIYCAFDSRKKKKKQEGAKTQTPINPYVNPRSNQNFDKPKRIDIKEAKPKVPAKDHERYSAIDRKIFNR